MDASAIRITRRLVNYMLERAQHARANTLGQRPFKCPNCAQSTNIVDVDINKERDLAFFQGLGLGLAICFEEMTGSTARDKTPKGLMEWALSLPNVPYPRVGV